MKQIPRYEPISIRRHCTKFCLSGDLAAETGALGDHTLSFTTHNVPSSTIKDLRVTWIPHINSNGVANKKTGNRLMKIVVVITLSLKTEKLFFRTHTFT
jgi:hypothetical protein